MKTNALIILSFLFLPFCSEAQDEKPELNLQFGYHSLDNKIPYLKLSTKLRKDNSLQTVPGVKVQLFMNEESDAGLLGDVVTNSEGLAKFVLPVSAKGGWDSVHIHKFFAVVAEGKEYVETRAEIEITPLKISIDTTTTDEGKRAVSISATQFNGDTWEPAPDVELKIGVVRSAGLLPIGEEETYTTDSTGTVAAEFIKDSLPTSMRNGNIVLSARVEDNDLFGNHSVQKEVPWGIYMAAVTQFNERSLWARSNKAPLWLLFMAVSIIAAVWGVIAYLVYLFIRIRNSGKQESFYVSAERPSVLVD